jgi:hypothetical protein
MVHANRSRILTTMLTASLIVVVAGCGGGLKTYPVEGRITYDDGSPVKGGTISFESDSGTATDGKPTPIYARGTIGADGSFRLVTNRELKGAIAGVHRVAIDEPPVAGSDFDVLQAGPRNKRVIPAKFASYNTSGLEVTIEPRMNVITITLQRP